jgi:hypothetical protein
MANEGKAIGLVGYARRIAVVAVAYFVATMVSGGIVTAVGMQFPQLPGQTYNPALGFIGSLLLAAALIALARWIRGSGAVRWLILTVFTYVSYGLNNQIEASVFTTLGGTGTMLIFWLIPCLVGCGAAILLVPAPTTAGPVRTVFAGHPLSRWWWRVVLAWLAFPVVYYLFGMLVSPVVIGAYRHGQSGLVLPAQHVVIAAVALRSLFFLAVTVPILRTWSGSRRGLVLTLGGAFFVMVGAVGLIVGTWMPATLRIAHGIEILLDSIVYAWVLVTLLVPGQRARDVTDQVTVAD